MVHLNPSWKKISEIQAVSLIGGSIPGKEEVIENGFVPQGTPLEQQQWFSVMFGSYDFIFRVGTTGAECCGQHHYH